MLTNLSGALRILLTMTGLLNGACLLEDACDACDFRGLPLGLVFLGLGDITGVGHCTGEKTGGGGGGRGQISREVGLLKEERGGGGVTNSGLSMSEADIVKFGTSSPKAAGGVMGEEQTGERGEIGGGGEPRLLSGGRGDSGGRGESGDRGDTGTECVE